jgi:hypothetical protein
MTGNTIVDVKRFDEWIANNYNELLCYCKKYRIEEDILNDCYINIKDRISRSGFTESYFKTYVIKSLRNLKINEAKKNNNKHWINYDDEHYTQTIETRLKDNEETDIDTQQYREEVLYFSKMMFKYIEKKYSSEWQFVFRSYYLMPNRFTYSKLTTMTGFNKNLCTKIIQTMKKDIRTGFLDWLKENG